MKIALTLPGFAKDALNNPVPNLKSEFTDLASILTPLLNIAFYLAIFLAFIYLVWGAFTYLMAQGKKEDLAKARNKITWALVGMFVMLSAFVIVKFASEIFTPKGGVPF